MVPAPLKALSHSIVFGMPPSVLLFSSGALLLAGFIKGGSAAWSAGNRDRPLTMVMTPDQTALLVVQKAATNIWQALTGKHAPAAAAVLADAPRHLCRFRAWGWQLR